MKRLAEIFIGAIVNLALCQAASADSVFTRDGRIHHGQIFLGLNATVRVVAPGSTNVVTATNLLRVVFGSAAYNPGFPDATANPYLAFAAMLIAGLDGIQNKINPGDPMDKNLYDLPPEELEGVPVVCGSLREALGELDADRDFLKAGDVFSDDVIDGYMELKWEEVYNFEHTPHPVEWQMYYSS